MEGDPAILQHRITLAGLADDQKFTIATRLLDDVVAVLRQVGYDPMIERFENGRRKSLIIAGQELEQTNSTLGHFGDTDA